MHVCSQAGDLRFAYLDRAKHASSEIVLAVIFNPPPPVLSAQGFVRSTTKYWVRAEDVSVVKYHILQVGGGLNG